MQKTNEAIELLVRNAIAGLHPAIIECLKRNLVHVGISQYQKVAIREAHSRSMVFSREKKILKDKVQKALMMSDMQFSKELDKVYLLLSNEL